MRRKGIFNIPKGQKVTEKYLRRVLVISVCSILLCMSCLAGTTWAWFAVSVENTGNVIQIATVEAHAMVSLGEDEITPLDDGTYSLDVGTYTVGVQVASDSTATDIKPYAIFSIDGVPMGCSSLVEDTSVATYTTSNQIRNYATEVKIEVYKKCKFSWEVSRIKPDGAEELAGNVITVPSDIKVTGGRIHISFDDVEKCFNNLKSKGYSSLYEEPFFAWLKGLHDTYGAKFSLYTYNSVLKDAPSTYAADFAAASDWLKIGLHADNSSNSTGFSTYDQGKAAWNTFVGYVKTITGTTDSIDRMPRLHYFAGAQAALKGMKDAECGALGFLAADDNRNSYYFDSTVSANLYNTDHITDLNNGLVFLNTDMRGDWFLSTFTSSNTYRKPTHATVYDEMKARYSSDAYTEMLEWCIFFSHEWQFYDGTTLSDGKQWTEDACRFAFENGIIFGYPQGYAFGNSQYDIPVDDGTTAVFDGVTLNVVDDFSKVQFVNGFTINGSGLQYEAKTSRAISKTEVLKVSDSMRKLSLDLTKLSIKDKLYYTVYEFSDRPLNSSTFKTGGGTWTQDDVTLADTTQYIIIIFKNETGADFTAEDLALLNQCVSFGDVASSGDNTENGTDTNPDDNTGTNTDTATTTRDGETVTIVSNLADIVYVRGSYSGGANSTPADNKVGRAISRYYVLKVNGGETLSLQQNIKDVMLYFAIKEFTDIPLTAEKITSGGQTYQSWLSDPVTLHKDTRYIVIGFKNGEGTVDFTDEQLAKLNTCLAIGGSVQSVNEASPTEPPATDPPATDPPATDPPATDPPATDPPATDPPATDPPATDPPATDPPATDPPATDPPATEPPATNPPSTERSTEPTGQVTGEDENNGQT